MAFVDILKRGGIIMLMAYDVLLVQGCRPVLRAATGLKTYGFSPIREELTEIKSGS